MSPIDTGMGLLDVLFGRPKRSTGIEPLAFEQWLQYFTFNGLQYPFFQSTSMGNEKQEEPDSTFVGYVQGAYRSNGVVFACMLARLMLFSEARFQFRQRRNGRPGDLFGSPALGPLEKPWANATTGDLLARMIQDADIAGNFYAVRNGQTIRRMRPDWVTIVLGSELEPDDPGLALDAEVLGYVYQPGGPGGRGKPRVLLPEQIAHFAPIPDPLARFRGMSWLTPVMRDIMGDQAATTHKLRFFERGATSNYAVTADPAASIAEFRQFVELFENRYSEFMDAYRTIFLAGGATITPIGSDMEKSQFKDVQGAGETRIAAAAGVPPVIVGLSEGLAAATYSNYAMAMRRFSDLTMRPLWRNAAGSLASVLQVPDGAELWYDDRDIPALQEDVKDAADAIQVQSQSIKGLTEAGFDPDSVVDAVVSGDLKRLTHTGLLSVQMQKPGESTPAANGKAPASA